jgi:hypothetical protein
MIKLAKKFLIAPFSFFITSAKSIASLSSEISRVGRGEYAHAVDNGGFEAAIAATPAGRRAPAHVIASLRMIAAITQIAALAAVSFTAYWVIASEARLIEILNFVVFSAGLVIAAAVASFTVAVARGGKRSFLANLADPLGLLAEPWVSKRAAGG